MGFGDRRARGVYRTSAQRHHDLKTEHSTITLPPCKHPDLRAELEADPPRWLKHYLAEAYPRPFDKPHLAIIDGAIHASDTGGRFAVVAERGIGKSTELWGLILYLKLSGRQPFPVCLPWSAKPLKKAMSFWKSALCFNRRLADDYPEFVTPFVHAKGVSQRLNSQTWEHNGKQCGARLQLGDGMIVFPDSKGAIGGSTINGNPKGLNFPQEDGTVLRPTLALIDDVQDRKTAKSADLIADTIVKIDGDIGGLGEAGVDFPMLISGNCTMPHDVMAHYLADDGWQSIRVPCVESWPDGWEDLNSPCRSLWTEWRAIFLHDEREALEFYLDGPHSKTMTAGMVLSSPHSYAITKTTPDPCYGAMRQYFKMGHDAFWAEKQQQPIEQGVTDRPYNLTKDVILSRTDKTRPALTVPPWVETVHIATDLNPSYAFSTAIAGFGRDQTAAVIGYDLFIDPPLPIMGNEPTSEDKRKLFEALTIHGREIAGWPVKCRTWGIDCSSGYFDTVIRFCAQAQQLCGLTAIAMRGTPSIGYKPFGKAVVGQPREECHMRGDENEGRRRRWLAWNTDYWREVSQKAWLGSIGAPGSVSLFAGKHDQFAEQVACESIIRTGPGLSGKQEWIWKEVFGKPHDFGDCMSMLYALAAWDGIGTGGHSVKREPRRGVPRTRLPSRQASVAMED